MMTGSCGCVGELWKYEKSQAFSLHREYIDISLEPHHLIKDLREDGEHSNMTIWEKYMVPDQITPATGFGEETILTRS